MRGPVVLGPGAARLLDRLAPALPPVRRLDPARPPHPGLLVARVAGEAGDRAWFVGALPHDLVEEAAAAPAPVSVLVRRAPGGEAFVYALAAAARRLPFRADLGGLAPAAVRLPHPRVAAGLAAYRFVEHGRPVLVVAPAAADLFDALDRLAGVEGVAVTTPRRLARALHDLAGAPLMAAARDRLLRMDPELSSRGRPDASERTAVVAAALAGPVALWTWPSGAWAAAHVLSAASFVLLGYFRALAVSAAPARAAPPPAADAELPFYTVLVPLCREAHMVRGLVAALERIDYPPDRLEIVFLLEADDGETVAAVDREIAARPWMIRTLCPPGTPRTKPRALCRGLVAARGEIVTVYDAEDRPHPGQLRAAVAAFRAGPPDLACLQARLEIDGVRTALQRQFAVEYAILFEGVLPWLAARRLPVPLGGTSNHFRRAALEAAHGWDPWNVTEDADLGMRLVRYGFAVDVLDSATREHAPATLAVWLAQRRRWIKGWMVTWIVHGRRPLALARETGWRNAGVFHLHSAAAVVAPLCHPIGLAMVAAHVAGVLPIPRPASFAGDVLVAASALGLAFGYGASILLARRVLARRGRRDLAAAAWLMPIYWLLVSLAAWRALAELVLDPASWAKTPHEAHDGSFADRDEDGEGMERVKGIEPSS